MIKIKTAIGVVGQKLFNMKFGKDVSFPGTSGVFCAMPAQFGGMGSVWFWLRWHPSFVKLIPSLRIDCGQSKYYHGGSGVVLFCHRCVLLQHLAGCEHQDQAECQDNRNDFFHFLSSPFYLRRLDSDLMAV